jgi:hypothetical protein
MDKSNDAVVGFITGYKFEKIAPWVNSLLASGFSGHKFMICYNIEEDVINKLKNLNFNVININMNEQFNIVNIRFLHIWQILNQLRGQLRYIINTDVADVIFQSDPSDWLEQNIGDKKLVVACESLKYKDEAWGIHNMYKSFGPLAADYMKETPIYNAGTTAGVCEDYLDFCYNVSLLCNGAPMFVEGGGGPDQAAVNLLLSLKAYKDNTLFVNHDVPWACQCGTTADPNKIDSFRPNLLSREPVFEDGCVYNTFGQKYVMVHQYNRVPEWKKQLEEKYNVTPSTK